MMIILKPSSPYRKGQDEVTTIIIIVCNDLASRYCAITAYTVSVTADPNLARSPPLTSPRHNDVLPTNECRFNSTWRLATRKYSDICITVKGVERWDCSGNICKTISNEPRATSARHSKQRIRIVLCHNL